MNAAKDLRLPDTLRHTLQAMTQIKTYTAGVGEETFFKRQICSTPLYETSRSSAKPRTEDHPQPSRDRIHGP